MIKSRLQALRSFLDHNQLDAILVPSNDPHQSEYPPSHWNIRSWISGFTGSAGLVAVTLNEAGLWTDSRYFIQAANQLDGTEIVLHKVIDRSNPGYLDWLCSRLKAGSKLAIIDQLVPVKRYRKIKDKLKQNDLSVQLIEDPFQTLWKERPDLPDDPVFDHPVQFAGLTRKDKLEIIREKMAADNCSFHLLTTLDDISWSLNLKSSDVECNPVFVAYLLIAKKYAVLYIKPGKITNELSANLEKDGIQIKAYDNINDDLSNRIGQDKILLDLSVLNMSLYSSIQKCEFVDKPQIPVLLKAIKSEHELACIRNAMIKDGVALAKAFYWLENTLKSDPVSEYRFAQKLAECRSQQEHYFGESFHAIVGYNANGAIVHYRPDAKESAEIRSAGILLVDSGGQYMDGTTDITRTIALSEPEAEVMENYTLVLKGMIALSKARLPKGSTGVQMDSLARQFLWNREKNYAHGTGHGVGFFNNVHEGPQSISPACNSRARNPIQRGMIFSNEPGYYEEGTYGIRIENILACKHTENEDFICFESLTLFPIDTRLIDNQLLTAEEKNWLNEYHDLVFKKLSPMLDTTHKEWLSHKCQHI